MGDLEDIQKKIYQQKPWIQDRPESTFSPVRFPKGEKGWLGLKGMPFFKRVSLLFLFLFLIIVGIFALSLFRQGGFSEENIDIRIVSQENASSVEITQWQVDVTNKNTIDIIDAKLTFEYPKNTLPVDDIHLSEKTSLVDIGTIQAEKSIARVFKARLFGKEDDRENVKAVLTFKPQGFSTTLKKEVVAETKIVSSPVSFIIQGPKEIQNGEESDFSMVFKNGSDFDLPLIRVRLELPKGFSLYSSKPLVASSDTVWEIASFKAGQEETISFKGVFEGEAEGEKVFQALLEVPFQEDTYSTLAEDRLVTKIMLSPFTFSIKANGEDSPSAKLGDTIGLSFEYKNNSSDAITNIVIEGELVGEAVDMDSIETKGLFNPATGRIRFDAAALPSLQKIGKGESGEVALSFNIKDKLPLKSYVEKNFQIRVEGTISSETPPSSFSARTLSAKAQLVIPLSTKVQVKIDGVYKGGPFSKIGSVPPRVGQETAYTVYWRITNLSNDIHDVEITASLPSWAQFTGMKQANFDANGLHYDDAIRQIIWDIPNLPAATGFLLPVYEGIFQISLNPTYDQKGNIIDIIGPTHFKGVDVFTKDAVIASAASLKTDLGGKLQDYLAKVAD